MALIPRSHDHFASLDTTSPDARNLAAASPFPDETQEGLSEARKKTIAIYLVVPPVKCCKKNPFIFPLTTSGYFIGSPQTLIR